MSGRQARVSEPTPTIRNASQTTRGKRDGSCELPLLDSDKASASFFKEWVVYVQTVRNRDWLRLLPGRKLGSKSSCRC